MDPLLLDLQNLIEARNERYELAGLLRRPERRSSLEIQRQVRRRREQERSAA